MSADVVSVAEWLGNLAEFFVLWFCWLFWGLNLQKSWQTTKRSYVFLKQLTNRNNVIMQLMHSQGAINKRWAG